MYTFGLNSATEVFQKKNDQHLQALKAYIRIVADGIIIAAGTVD